MISVCLASYNGEKYIRQQLESILRQLTNDDEVIISDDSSTDATLAIIESMADERIKVLKNNTFKSPIFNLENALKNASGDYIFLSDQDDIWLPGKVAVQLELLSKVDLVFSDATIVDANEKIIRKSFFNSSHNTGFWRNLMFNRFLGATMAFNQSVLQKSMPFPKYIPMHDQWIGLTAERYFKTAYIDKPLILYRRHGENASYTGEKSKNSFMKKVSFRCNMLRAILSR